MSQTRTTPEESKSMLSGPYQAHLAHHRQTAWTPGLIRRIPWQGYAGLVAACLAITSSAVVLVLSNGKPLSAWTYQPTVLLAITSTVTNIFLHYSLQEGVAVAWWRLALKSDTTVAALHRSWDFGNSFKSALLAGWRFNLIACACILTTLAPINGPLLQRASRVTFATIQSPIQLNLQLRDDRVALQTGWVSGRTYAISLLTGRFSKVVQQWNSNSTISIANTGCSGSCSAKVKALGFAANCSAYQVPFDIRPTMTDGVYDPSKDPSIMYGSDVFGTNFKFSVYKSNNISLSVFYKPSADCFGSLMVRNCSLRTAAVEYPVAIDGNASTISLDPATTIFDDNIHTIFDGIDNENMEGPTAFGGVWLALSNKYTSTAHATFAAAVGYEILTTGNTALQYTQMNDSNTHGGMDCSVNFKDPLDDLLASTRELMFRTSVALTNTVTPMQSLVGIQTDRHAVYESHYEYLTGAVIISLAATLAILATFHGYWFMGRSISMSPIETARAFGAELICGADGNANIAGILQEVGDLNVRYGVADGASERSRSRVRSGYATSGSTCYDEWKLTSTDEFTGPRLRITQTGQAGRPVKGAFYFC